MEAVVITIGDEILIGQTTDTNSAYIAQKISELGIKIDEMVSISDREDHIKSTLDQYVGKYDFIFITGGLGPTNDDITKKVLTEYFNDELAINEHVLKRTEDFFKRFNKPFLEVNRLQALLPKNARIIENKLGTASGMWFQSGKSNIFSMPGVPYEMKGLLKDFLEDVEQNYDIGNFYHATLRVMGIGESYWAEKIKGWEELNRSEGISVSYLPSVGTLKLRLTGRLDQKEIIDQRMQELSEKFPNYIIGEEQDTIEKVVGKILKEKGKTLSTVESCTGGAIARKIVSNSGSSAYYMGSIVSYANELKTALVNVSPETIKRHGAVSEQTVIEMAENGREKLETDYCISVSGIAGPNGGSEEKPVGTVWVAIASPKGVFTKKFSFGHTRKRNIQSTVLGSLSFLRLILTEYIQEPVVQ